MAEPTATTGSSANSGGLHFGWLSPVIGNAGSNHEPIVMYQDREILAEALPYFDSLWVADHFYGFDAKTDPFLEAWTTLTWLAARYEHIELCHHVLGHGYRPAALTAKMAATLQTLSGGRFVLGIGAGWREDEYAAYGYDFPSPRVRFGQLEDVIDICRLMWTEDEPTFHGRYFSIDGASAPPLPNPVPKICIGARGTQIGLPLVGRKADRWNCFYLGADDWQMRHDVVRRAAEGAGRDPNVIEVGTTVERPLPTSDVESEKLLEELTVMRELGITHFTMDFGHPLSAEPVHRFAEQVIQEMRGE
jgi:alkanesulfonate monooxygenase SsuD/methylene tetrahydromethanopterin reductase-like flavin-dependent oxidoreductase (luciferase family)